MNEIKQEYINQLVELVHTALKHYKKYQSNLSELYPNGITSTELSVIKIVHEKTDIILKEVSESLDIPGSTLTSAIDRLEQKNLIIRTVSKKNRHSFGLELTEEGKKINAKHEKEERQIWHRILSMLDSEEDIESLVNLLSVIVNKLDLYNND